MKPRFLRWLHQIWCILRLDLTHRSVTYGKFASGILVETTYVGCDCGRVFYTGELTTRTAFQIDQLTQQREKKVAKP